MIHGDPNKGRVQTCILLYDLELRILNKGGKAMSNSINQNMVKIVAEIAIFLEFTSEELLDPDASVEALERLASELQLMNVEDRISFALQLKQLSGVYAERQKAQFICSLPRCIGLE